jgi:hypothetical protein
MGPYMPRQAAEKSAMNNVMAAFRPFAFPVKSNILNLRSVIWPTSRRDLAKMGLAGIKGPAVFSSYVFCVVRVSSSLLLLSPSSALKGTFLRVAD